MSVLPQVDPLDVAIAHQVRKDQETGDLIIKRTQDVSAILENNREMANANDQGWRKKDDKSLLIASIPNIVIEMWLKEGINVWLAKVDRRTGRPNWHLKQVLRRLDDPEWRYLKTTSMRVS